MIYQTHQDPWLAIVVDPHRTMSAGVKLFLVLVRGFFVALLWQQSLFVCWSAGWHVLHLTGMRFASQGTSYARTAKSGPCVPSVRFDSGSID